MTQAVTATLHSRASLNVRAIVLPRAQWESERTPNGQIAWKPKKGTWYGHVVRGATRYDVIVVPMIGCPGCGKISFLSHAPGAAKVLAKMTGMPIPVAHSIDSLGRVSPDVKCGHGRCDFLRKVYLDRWNKTKALYAIAYVNLDKGQHGEIEIAYSHAIDAKEARFHLGLGNFRIIGAGPAIGFFVDEKTGRMTTD
jgi:hypothetical protein